MLRKILISFFFTLLLTSRLFTDSADNLQFGKLWQQIKRLQENDELYEMIQKRRSEIFAIKSHWKKKIPTYEDELFLEKLQTIMAAGKLEPSSFGCGAAYFLYDETGSPKYVIKPFDEEILCLNNRKHFASPYNSLAFRVKDHIPLYRSAQTEALASTLATLLGFPDLTPNTRLAVLSHPQFFDISDHLDRETQTPLLKKLGPSDREKLCSVQEFIPNTCTLFSLVEQWLAENLSEEELLGQIDPSNFEKLVLLIWLLYDTDAHAENIYVLRDESGKYRLIKIDNGLAFPEKNGHLLNALYFFPQAKKPPSEELCQIIATLPLEKFENAFGLYEMEGSLEAFNQRVHLLQNLIKQRTLSLRDIDMRLRFFEIPSAENITSQR